MAADFEKQSYWHTRFTHEEAFEWLTPSSTFLPFITPYLSPSSSAPASASSPTSHSTLPSTSPPASSSPPSEPKPQQQILHLGSGTSDLHTHLRAASCADVTNVDYEPLALDRGKDIEKRVFGDVRMRYVVADVTKLPFPFTPGADSNLAGRGEGEGEGRDVGGVHGERQGQGQGGQIGRFNLVIDKSTVDAVSCGGEEALLAMARGVRACLAPGGVWISLSYSAARFELPELKEVLFEVEVLGKIPVPKVRMTDPDVFYWVYLLSPR